MLELLQFLHGLLNWSFAIKAVGVVKIDVVHPKTFERALTCLATVFGRGVYPALAIFHTVCELGGEEDVVPFTWVGLEPFACNYSQSKALDRGRSPSRTEHILIVHVHVRGVPKELARRVALVKHFETIFIGLWGAIEGTLNPISSCSATTRVDPTYETHGTIAHPSDLGAVLAQFCSGQLVANSTTGDVSENLLSFLHLEY